MHLHPTSFEQTWPGQAVLGVCVAVAGGGSERRMIEFLVVVFSMDGILAFRGPARELAALFVYRILARCCFLPTGVSLPCRCRVLLMIGRAWMASKLLLRAVAIRLSVPYRAVCRTQACNMHTQQIKQAQRVGRYTEACLANRRFLLYTGQLGLRWRWRAAGGVLLLGWFGKCSWDLALPWLLDKRRVVGLAICGIDPCGQSGSRPPCALLRFASFCFDDSALSR